MARTRSPAWTARAPVRPEIGALIVVYCRLKRAFSTWDWSAASVASRAEAVAIWVSYWSRGIRPRSNSSLYRVCCDWAFFDWAESRASTASAWRSAASNGRASRVNSVSPCRMSWPSRKLTLLSWPVTCALTCTVTSGSAVPTAGMVTGIALTTVCAVTTGTGPPPPPRPPERPPRPLPAASVPAGCGGDASLEHAVAITPARTRVIVNNRPRAAGEGVERTVISMDEGT